MTPQTEFLGTSESGTTPLHLGALDRFQHYYDFAPLGFLVLEKTGKILEANYRAGAMIGLPRGELVGQSLLQFLDSEDPESLQQHFEEVQRYGRPRNWNVKMLSAHSTLCQVKLRTSYLSVGADAKIHYLVMIQKSDSDIQTADSLRFQSQIVEYLAAGVCIIRLGDRRIAYTNQAFERMFGFSRDELLGKSVDVLMVSDSANPEELREEVGREIRLKGQWKGEVRGQRKNGSAFWCRVHTSHCDHPELGPVWIAVHEDVSDLRKMAEELASHQSNLEGMVQERTVELSELNEKRQREVDHGKRAESKYLDLYDNSPDMKVSVDPYTGSILECNNTYLKNLQRTRNEVLGRPVFDFYDPSCLKKAREVLEEFLEKEELHGVVLRLCRRDGQPIDVSLDANAVYDRDKKLLYCRSSYHDITDRARVEKLEMAKEVAERSDRMKSEFLAAMSHEVRTPLNSIIGLTEILLHSSLDSKQRGRLETVMKSGNTLLTVINDILDFSRIEAGHLDIESSSFRLQTILMDAVDLFRDKASEKGIELYAEGLDKNSSWLCGDASRIQQVVTNLLSNSIKFTEQGSVSLKLSLKECRKNNQRFRVSVTDTGIGIPESKRKEVFKAFTQAHGSVSRNLGGTGLGLAICGQLIGRMEGVMNYERMLPTGSCFWFELSLPVDEDTNAVPELLDLTTLDDAPPKWPKTPRVLLVEDDPANQEVGEAMLLNLGCIADQAGDGREALARLEESDYDLILMDCLLPEKDGLEVTRDVRSFQKTQGKSTPIVALTAHAMKGEREKCLSAGMDDFLTKPIRMSTP